MSEKNPFIGALERAEKLLNEHGRRIVRLERRLSDADALLRGAEMMLEDTSATRFWHLAVKDWLMETATSDGAED